MTLRIVLCLGGINKYPRTSPIYTVRYSVLKAAGTIDAEDFNPYLPEEE